MIRESDYTEISRKGQLCVKLSLIDLIVLTICIVLAMYSDFHDISFLKYGATFIAIIIGVYNPKKSLYVCAFILLNNTTFMLMGINSYTLISAIVLIIYYFPQARNISLPILMFLFYGLIHSVLLWDVVVLIKEYFKVAIMLWFLYCYFQDNKECLFDVWRNIIIYAALGAAISFVSAIILNPAGLAFARFDISTGNTINFAGIQVALISVYLFMFILCGYKRNLSLVLLSLLAVFGIFSASRTFLYTIGAGIFLIVAFVLPSFNKKLFFRVIGIIAGVIILYFILDHYINLSNNISYVIYRITNPHNGDISTGRFDIWKSYYDAFMRDKMYLWFGAGKYSNLGINRMAHNAVIELVATYGILGSALLMYVYCWIANKCSYAVRKDIPFWLKSLSFIPLFCVVISGLTSHSLASFPVTLQFMLACLGISMVRFLFAQPGGNI